MRREPLASCDEGSDDGIEPQSLASEGEDHSELSRGGLQPLLHHVAKKNDGFRGWAKLIKKVAQTKKEGSEKTCWEIIPERMEEEESTDKKETPN